MRLYAVFSFGAMPSKILKVKKVKNIPWQSPINCLHAHIITFVLTGRHHTYLDFRNIACTTPCVNPMRVSARAKKLSTKKAEVPWPQWAPHAPVTWYRYLLRPVLYGPWLYRQSIPYGQAVSGESGGIHSIVYWKPSTWWLFGFSWHCSKYAHMIEDTQSCRIVNKLQHTTYYM